MTSTLDPQTEQQRLVRERFALAEIAKTLNSALNLPELLQAILNRIIGVLEAADIGVVMLWDQSAGLFRAQASFGYERQYLEALGLRAGESVTGKVFDEGLAQLLASPDEVHMAMQDMRDANREYLARALGHDRLPTCTIAAPIMVGAQKYGVLFLGSLKDTPCFTTQDLPFIQTLADLIGLAIDRARLEAQADAVRQAHEIRHMRAELMATLSHELRLPLTAIKGYATALLLEDVEWEAEKRVEFLHQIEEECHSMEVMLTDILDSSLIDVNQISFEPQPLRLPQVAREIASEIQLRTRLHHLMVDFPEIFPIVAADPHWIRQVFRNILDNAIKYSPDGGLVIIQGEVRQQDVVVSISDQGIGISPEDLIPLFEKYFRIRAPNGIQVAGTGLGLPIARMIIEAHGGRIWAESKVGQGTMICFCLPTEHPGSEPI